VREERVPIVVETDQARDNGVRQICELVCVVLDARLGEDGSCGILERHGSDTVCHEALAARRPEVPSGPANVVKSSTGRAGDGKSGAQPI
jgi:hypothetical protein